MVYEGVVSVNYVISQHHGLEITWLILNNETYIQHLVAVYRFFLYYLENNDKL